MMRQYLTAQWLLIIIPVVLLIVLLGGFIYLGLFNHLQDMASAAKNTIVEHRAIDGQQSDLWLILLLLAGGIALFLAGSMWFDYRSWCKRVQAPCPVCHRIRPDHKQTSFKRYWQVRHQPHCQCFPRVQQQTGIDLLKKS